jgi:hypothetical protein
MKARCHHRQERRDEARRDYSDRVIDWTDWLDIRQRSASNSTGEFKDL